MSELQRNRFNCKEALTLDGFNASLRDMKRQTCKDVWGLMLTRIAGALSS